MDIDYTQHGMSEKRFRSLKGKQKVRRAIRSREGDKRSDITANHSRLSAVVCFRPRKHNSIPSASPPEPAPLPFYAQERGGRGPRGNCRKPTPSVTLRKNLHCAIL